MMSPSIRTPPAERRQVAAAAGHDPGEKGMETVRSFLTRPKSMFAASMLHDLEKGSMVEADHVVGDMIARAKKAGIATVSAPDCPGSRDVSAFGAPKRA